MLVTVCCSVFFLLFEVWIWFPSFVRCKNKNVCITCEACDFRHNKIVDCFEWKFFWLCTKEIEWTISVYLTRIWSGVFYGFWCCFNCLCHLWYCSSFRVHEASFSSINIPFVCLHFGHWNVFIFFGLLFKINCFGKSRFLFEWHTMKTNIDCNFSQYAIRFKTRSALSDQWSDHLLLLLHLSITFHLNWYAKSCSEWSTFPLNHEQIHSVSDEQMQANADSNNTKEINGEPWTET